MSGERSTSVRLVESTLRVRKPTSVCWPVRLDRMLEPATSRRLRDTSASDSNPALRASEPSGVRSGSSTRMKRRLPPSLTSQVHDGVTEAA